MSFVNARDSLTREIVLPLVGTVPLFVGLGLAVVAFSIFRKTTRKSKRKIRIEEF